MERVLRVGMQAAYVLHRRPYRETSLLLEVFSREHGRVPLVARGARRSRRGARAELEPFRALLLSFNMRGEMGTLLDAEFAAAAAEAPRGEALPSAFYVNELLMRLVHRFDPYPTLFDAYADLLTGIAEPAKREPVLRIFEKRLLEETGYGLVLDHDTGSGAPLQPHERYVYAAEEGPVLLSDERQAAGPWPVVRGSTLLSLAAETLGDDTDSLRESKRLMRFVIDHYLGGKPLKSRSLFRARP